MSFQVNGFQQNAFQAGVEAPASGVTIAASNTYSDNTGSITDHPVNLPTGIVSGNLLLVFFAIHAAPTVTTPSGWTQIAGNVNGDTFRIFARIADGLEGSTVTVTCSASDRASAVSYRITGNANGVTSSEIAVSTVVDASTATPDPPSLTPSWGSAANLWIAVTFSADGNFTFNSYPTNYSLGQQNVQTGSGTGNAVSVAGYVTTAASEDPGTFSTTSAKTRSTYTLAVKPGANAYTITVTSSAVTLTGSSVNTKGGRVLSATTSAVTLTGSSVNIKSDRRLSVTSSAVTLTGTSVAINASRRLSVTSSAVTLTGSSVAIRATRSIAVTSAAVTLTGSSVAIRASRAVAVTSSAVTLTGTSVAIRASRALTATTSSVTLTGSSVTLTYTPVSGAKIITVISGAIVLTGSSVNLTFSAPANQNTPPQNLGGGGYHLWPEVSWLKKKKKKPKKAELVAEVAAVVEQALPQVTEEESRAVALRLVQQISYDQLRRIQTLEAFIARVEAELAEMDDEEVLLLAA